MFVCLVRNFRRFVQIQSRTETVNSSCTLPVLSVVAGSNKRTWHSSSATALNTGNVQDEFALLQPYIFGLRCRGRFATGVAKLHAKPAFHHQKHFVLVVVMMPGEWSLEFYQLHVLSIEFANDARIPMVVNQ